MVESGDWLVPRYQGQPFFDKPILSYWLIAVAMQRLRLTPRPRHAWCPALAALAGAAGHRLARHARRSTVARGSSRAPCWRRRWPSSLRARRDVRHAAHAAGRRSRSRLRSPRDRPGARRLLVPLLGRRRWGSASRPRARSRCCCPALAHPRSLAWQRRRERPLLRGRPRSRSAALALRRARASAGSLSSTSASAAEPLVYFFLRENLRALRGRDLRRRAARSGSTSLTYLAQGLPWSLFLPLALARLLARGPGRAAQRPLARAAGWRSCSCRSACRAARSTTTCCRSTRRSRCSSAATSRAPVASGRSRLGACRAGAARGDTRARGAAAAAGCPPSGCRARPGAALLVAVVATGALLSLARGRCARRRRVLAFSLALVVAASGFTLVALFLPAFARAQPNRELVEDVARERRYRPEPADGLLLGSDARPARRAARGRITAVAECDLWSFAGSREPYLLLATPAQDASFRVDPRYRPIATYRYLPADTLTFQGLLSPQAPGEIMLGANFPTRDPVAEGQAEARVPEDARPGAGDRSLSGAATGKHGILGASPRRHRCPRSRRK